MVSIAGQRAGAKADGFASADEKNMTKLADADLADGDPQQFATNKLTIVTPPRNPGAITGLADFGDESKNIVVCAPEVPCGAAALKVAELAGAVSSRACEGGFCRGAGADIDPCSTESKIGAGATGLSAGRESSAGSVR